MPLMTQHGMAYYIILWMRCPQFAGLDQSIFYTQLNFGLASYKIGLLRVQIIFLVVSFKET